jgi:hypothetical protein
LFLSLTASWRLCIAYSSTVELWNNVKALSYRNFGKLRKRIPLFEGSPASPVRPSDKSCEHRIMYSNGRKILTEESQSASLSITNCTWNGRDSKPSLQGETPGLIAWAMARILEARISLPHHWQEKTVVDMWGQETQTNYDDHISGQEDYRRKHSVVTDETQLKANLTFIWPDRASWYISTVKPTRCTIFEFIEYYSTSLFFHRACCYPTY